MKANFLDTHPLSPVQRARRSEWARLSRPGVRYVETDTVCFRVREGGSGSPTVVFFADGPNALEHHDSIFERVSSWTSVVVVDPPGFGFSTPNPNFDFTLGSFADAYAHLLLSLGKGPYVLCPTCINVYPSALIAAETPSLVSHLVLMQALDWEQEQSWTAKIVDPNGDLAKPYVGQEFNFTTRAIAAKTWYPNALGRADQIEDFLQRSCTCFDHDGNFCLASLIQSWFGPDAEQPSFRTFKQPVLAVWGMNDRSHRKSDKRSLLNIARNATFVEREGVGHFPEIEDPAWFESMLKQFVSSTGH